MAIIKTFETPQGVSATYHRLIRAEFNAANQSVDMTIAVYTGPAARASAKSAVWHEYISIPFSALNQDPLRVLYPLLTGWLTGYLHGGNPDVPSLGSSDITLKPAPTP